MSGTKSEFSVETTQRGRTKYQHPSRAYGEAISLFSWGYLVEALAHGGRYGYSTETGLPHQMAGVIRDLGLVQGHRIHFAYSHEQTARGDWHVHALLGSISRLTPADVKAIYSRHGFGATNVRLWDREKETGYGFKAMGNWDFNVVWNRKTRSQMQLCRRHLDRLIQSQKRQ